MKRKLAIVLTLVMMVLSFAPLAINAESSEIAFLYVATDGNDGAAGTIDAPLATIIGARNKIREMKSSGSIPTGGVVVYVRGGDYSLTESIKFTTEDSGTENGHIVYRSYPGEKAVLVGGVSLDASEFKPAQKDNITDRIIDENVKNDILTINIFEKGLNNIGGVFLEGAYSYIEPYPAAPSARGPELVVDGDMMTIARYPNDGYITVSEIVKDGYRQQGVPGHDSQGDIYAGIEIKSHDTRYLNWDKADDAALFGYWFYDWADQSLMIKDINKDAGTVSTTLSSRYGVKLGQKFYAYNLPEEIDAPGEYYIDRKTGILYLNPPKNFSEKSSVRMSYLEDNMININGASYIDIKNFILTSSRKSAIVMNSGQFNRVIGCEVEYTADYGIKVLKDTYNSGVLNCYVHDVNGGISMDGGVRELLTPGNNYTENCEVERFSRLSKTYKAGVSSGGVENRISHNEIHNSPHLAVSFSGFDQLVEHNEIYDVVKESDDAGAIYGGQTWLGRGLQVKNNYIHDLSTTSGQSVGISAVYLDGAQCDVNMEGNIVENISGSAFKINGGRDNNFVNNIVINSKAAVNLCLVTEAEYSYQTRLDTIVKSSLWSNLEDKPWTKEPFTSRYPEMMAMLEDEPMIPKNNTMKNNLIVNTEAVKLTSFSDNLLDMSGNYTTNTNPGFVNMSLRNYNLEDSSVAYNKIPGFNKLAFDEMGRYDKHALYKVKNAVVLKASSPLSLVCGKETKFEDAVINANGKIYVPQATVVALFGSESAKIASSDINGKAYVDINALCDATGKKLYTDAEGLVIISDDAMTFNSYIDGKIAFYLNEVLNVY